MAKVDIKSKRDVWIPAMVVLVGLCGLWALSHQYLNIETIKRIGRSATSFATTHEVWVFSAVSIAAAVSMMLSLPTKALLTLLAGALLGTIGGAVSTMIGVLLGTTVLFFSVRHWFRDRFAEKMGERMKRIERRISERPIRAMIGIRMFIALPYGPCTISAALSSMRYRDFLLGSVIGDTPVIVLYALAGKQLFTLASTGDALSPTTVAVLLITGFVLLLGSILGRVPSRMKG